MKLTLTLGNVQTESTKGLVDLHCSLSSHSHLIQLHVDNCLFIPCTPMISTLSFVFHKAIIFSIFPKSTLNLIGKKQWVLISSLHLVLSCCVSKFSSTYHFKMSKKESDKSKNQHVSGSNPWSKANPLSILFFAWIWPIFRKGTKKDLETQDLYPAPSIYESEFLANKISL